MPLPDNYAHGLPQFFEEEYLIASMVPDVGVGMTLQLDRSHSVLEFPYGQEKEGHSQHPGNRRWALNVGWFCGIIGANQLRVAERILTAMVQIEIWM
jgi:hypothetical protein